jgi:hypothetical protein
VEFRAAAVVSERDAFWARKQRALAQPPEPPREADYAPIEMPRNSPVGFVTAFFAVVGGFAMIWHIWWLAAFGVLGAFAATLFFAFRDKVEDEIRPTGSRASIGSIPLESQHERRHSCARPGARRRRVEAPLQRRRSPTHLEAGGRGLRVLGLPAERHRDVLGTVRGLRRAGGQRPPAARRATAVQPDQRRDRNRVPARIELRVRVDGPRR